jgi:hypothetical protein
VGEKWVQMKPLEAPRTMLVYAALGIVIWGILGISDLISGATWRLVLYILMIVVSAYLFIRALTSIRGSTRPEA